MVLKLIRWIRGYVCFRLTGKFPERFINICSQNGVNLWSPSPAKGGMRGKMSVFDYKKIRKYARKSKVRLQIEKRHGIPFLVERYKGRIGLLIGAVLFIVLTMFLSSFVWSVNLIGLDSLSQTAVEQTLKEYGLYEGCFKSSLNIQKIQRDTILSVPEIGWMSINVVDCSANVEIKEKAEVPDMNDTSYPCNLKARCDGVITGIEAANGTIEILRGSAVTEGQLLVNSVMEDKLGGQKFVHASGQIYADVEARKTFSRELESRVMMPQETYTDRYRGYFFGFYFPCSFGFSDYDTSIKQLDNYRLISERNKLPIGIEKERETECVWKDVQFSPEEARAALFKEMALYEAFAKNKSKVVSRDISGGSANGIYTLNVSYVFNENIAVKQELYVDGGS